MRVVAVSIWIFLNLTIFGLISYCYILWIEYWKVAKTAQNELHVKLVANLMQRPNIPDESKVNRLDLYDENQALPLEFDDDDTDDSIRKFKKNLIVGLRRSQREFKMKFFDKIALDENKNTDSSDKKSTNELYCSAKDIIRVKTIKKDMDPFHRSALKNVIPAKSFVQDHSKYMYHSCAIVSSAGSLHSSSLGNDIDAHDAVLRFNNAPTEGFEKDVGSKTTFRILNSRVLSNQSFHLSSLPIYKNVTLIGWDPGIKGQTLNQWFQEPNFDLFSAYKNYREQNPKQPFYLLHPEFIWTSWKFIQESSNFRIPLNPPSSGFIGMILMMEICQWVHIYEYLPSMRLTDKCHYYDAEKNIGCTFGNWHPLAAEKLITMELNSGTEKETFVQGKATVRGLNNNIQCH